MTIEQFLVRWGKEIEEDRISDARQIVIDSLLLVMACVDEKERLESVITKLAMRLVMKEKAS
jgi:hypothetical protein